MLECCKDMRSAALCGALVLAVGCAEDRAGGENHKASPHFLELAPGQELSVEVHQSELRVESPQGLRTEPCGSPNAWQIRTGTSTLYLSCFLAYGGRVRLARSPAALRDSSSIEVARDFGDEGCFDQRKGVIRFAGGKTIIRVTKREGGDHVDGAQCPTRTGEREMVF